MNKQVGRTWAGLHKSTNLTNLPLFTAGSTLPKGMAYAQHRGRCSWQGWREEMMKTVHTGGKVCNSLHHSACMIVLGSQYATLPRQSSLHGKDLESRSKGASLPNPFQRTRCRYLLWECFYSCMNLKCIGWYPYLEIAMCVQNALETGVSQARVLCSKCRCSALHTKIVHLYPRMACWLCWLSVPLSSLSFPPPPQWQLKWRLWAHASVWFRCTVLVSGLWLQFFFFFFYFFLLFVIWFYLYKIHVHILSAARV